MANVLKISSKYKTQSFKSNTNTFKNLPPISAGTDDRLQKQYNNLQQSLNNANQTYDDRNWIEKLLGINADTKQHAGVLQGTLDIITRPLDAVKASIFDLQHGKGGQEVLTDLFQGITQGKGKNLTGTQILGLENAHLDTFTKFIVNASVDIGLDPLTYVPGGVIFKGLKKVGTNFSKLPVVTDILQHAKTSELGIAVKNLYNTTKNTFGKAFSWMYGTSPEGKQLFTKINADKITTTQDLFSLLNNLTSVRDETARELFTYATKGELPASKAFKEAYPDTKKAKEFLDATIQKLGVENPKTTFKRWANENYNGNTEIAEQNLIKFITDSNIPNFNNEWENFVQTGNYLNPDGTFKDTQQAAQAFWEKQTTDWKELTAEEVKMRFNEGIYNDYILANPPTKTLQTVIKALNNGEIYLPINDPDATRTFLKQFSQITGLDDPLLDAKYIRKEAKDETGKVIRDVDENELKQAETNLKTSQEKLETYKGKKQKEIKRLQNKIRLAQKNLDAVKIGKKRIEYQDISKDVISSYFNVESLKNYGKGAYNQLEEALLKMKNSSDINVRNEYYKLMQGNQINTVRSWLQNAEGQGVKLTLKDKWNPSNLTYLTEKKDVIRKAENYRKLPSYNTGEKVKDIISKEINKGIQTFLKDNTTQEVLSQGVLGFVINDFSQLKGITTENAFEVTDNLTKQLLDVKISMPAYKLNPFKGYKSAEYISQLTYINSEMYRLLSRFGLDPTVLSKANILRNCVNPELGTFMRLIKIQQGSTAKAFIDLEKKTNYLGTNPVKVLNSEWLLNAPEINNALGFKLLSTDPLQSIAETLRIYPESLGFSAMVKNAIKTGDIRTLTAEEKFNYELKRIVPSGKKLIKRKEIIDRLSAVKELIPPDEYTEFENTINKFKEEDNLYISIGLEDQLSTISKTKSEVLTLADYLNKYIRAWKKIVLATPGYHMRNMFSNLSQTISAGIPLRKMIPESNQAYKDIVQVHKITNKVITQLGKTTEILNTTQKFENFTKSFLNEQEHNLFTEYTNLMRKGVTSQAKVNSDFWEVMNKLGKTTVKNNVFKKGWNTVFNANMKLSQVMDDGARLAAYRIAIKEPKYALNMGLKGASNDELAASFVRTTFYDYHALTGFEKNVLRKIFPFYTWSRKNLEFQLKTLIYRPEKFARLWKLFNDWDDAQGYDRTEEPDWVKENMWLPIVNGENVKFLKVGLPIQDLGEIFGGNGQLLSRLNPFYKVALESITGQDSFNNKPVTPLHSLQAMFWQPLQKLLVQPFDIPVGALPLGNGQTLGEIFGHPNDYSQKTSLWYQMNLNSLHQSYLFQQIQKLAQFRQVLKAQGIVVQSKRDLLKALTFNKFPTNPKIKKFKQYNISLKNLRGYNTRRR